MMKHDMMKMKLFARSRRFAAAVFALVALVVFGGCAPQQQAGETRLQVVATTTMLADLVRQIGGDHVQVTALMEAGIDPHLYKASAGDVEKMQKADMVVYNGLHLEGKMGEIFENLVKSGKTVVMIARDLPEDRLLHDETGAHDPHIWFDVMLWKQAAVSLVDDLAGRDPANEQDYRSRYEQYAEKLDELDRYIREQIAMIPEESRVLITAHDAFGYFGSAYGIEVMGLQGISTESEAGTADVKQLAEFIVENRVKAIFVESSVPKRSVEALREAVKSRGFDVAIGGELFSDSLGTPGTESETYIGTVKSNVDTIVGALK